MTQRIRLYSRAEAAAYLGVCVRMVDKLIRQGELAVTKVGRRVMLLESVLLHYCSRKTREWKKAGAR